MISVAFNIYFINKPEVSSLEKIEKKKDSVSTKSSAINKQQVLNKTRDNNLRGIKNDILEIKDNVDTGLQESKAEEKHPYIDASEIEKSKEAWRKKATDFMMQELALDNQVIDEYFQLDVRREQALSEFMRKRVEDNGGDQFFYTLEDIVEENKINIKFLDELKAMFGPEGYEQYKKFRNQHNRNIIETGEGFFLIEL